MLDFLLFTCTHSLISAETAHSVEALHHTTDFKFNWGMVMYDALIGRSRSVACTEFLDKHESEYMIFLDDDIVFKAGDIANILGELIKGKDVIGGLYATGGGMRLAHRGFNSQMVINGEPQEIEYLSTGFMGISRNILLKIVNELKLPYIKTTRSSEGELSHVMTLEKFPLLHKNTAEGAFYPFFESGARPYSLGGIYISEDWDFPLSVYTDVLMDDFRWQPLGNIKVGDKVVGFGNPIKNSRPYCVAEVTDTIEQKQELWHIITSKGEVWATSNHPLLTSSPCRFGTRWVIPRRMHKGQFLNMPIEVVRNPNINSRDYKLGYIKGIWSGDGTIESKHGYGVIEMTDFEAIERAHTFAEDLGLRVGDIKERKLNNDNWKPLYGFRITYGIREIISLVQNGFAMCQGFLAGIYDAEGSFRNGLLRIANKDKRISDEIEFALQQIGIPTKPNLRTDGLYEFAISNQVQVRRFWQSTLPAIKRKISLNGQGQNHTSIMQYEKAEILSIEKNGIIDDVACLTTTSGNFIANGFASHNCEKVRMVGGKVWAHTGVLVDHIKRAPVTAQGAIQANTVPRFQANHELWVDLSLYLGKSVQELVGRYGAGRAELELGEKWFNRKGTTEDFYRDNELYLYDLVQWNAMPFYQNERVNPLKSVIDSTILDFGCGIGTALFFLASGNKTLVGYDINKPILDFAEWRRKKLKLPNVSFTTELPDLSQFDLVIAIDTLEHIEDLKSLLLKLGAEMKPGARLYHADMFKQEAGHPMHFDHSANIDSWLKEAGFIVFDKLWAIKP